MNYSTFHLLKDLASFIRPYWKRFSIGTLIRLISDIVWLYPPIALGQIINFASTYQKGDPITELWWIFGFIWAAALYHYIAHDLCKYFIYPVAEQARLDAQLKTLSHMMDLDMEWHHKENSGNKLQRIDKGGEQIDALIRLYVDLFIESTVNIIGVTLVLSTLGWTVNTILIFFFITYFALSSLLNNKAKNQSLKANIEWEVFDGLVFESVNNIATVKALGLRKAILKRLTQASQKLMIEIKRRVLLYRTRGAALNLYREIFRQILIFFTVWQVLQGNIELGVIATMMFYFEKISASATEFAEVSHSLMLGRIALMRMKDILNEAPHIELQGSKALSENWKTLNFNKVSFKYKNHSVLKDLNLSIKRGEKIGFVGLSGAGKSTLFKLLLKLYSPMEGEIHFDKQSLKEIRRDSLLQKMAYVPQEIELFNFSLKENIALGGPSTTKEASIQTALQTAHVQDFLHKLPQGMDSLIGEKGIKLSGGERQRVGLARAIYKNPEILLLDEATSHLDVDSEAKIQDALERVFKGVTALVIAHRLSTLKLMDRIFVLSNGKIIEQGSFQDLIKQKGSFWALWKKSLAMHEQIH